MSDLTRPVVPDEDVRALLHMIATSMDFGSGFLDTEEVVVLRRVAHLVGMDPAAVTPRNMPHAFVPREHLPEPESEPCARCYERKDRPVHTDPWPFADDWKAPDE